MILDVCSIAHRATLTILDEFRNRLIHIASTLR
jgi:hypothetical protein